MAKLHYLYGTMNSGKSTALAQAWFNYYEGGKEALILKPIIDDREPDAACSVVSRIGAKAPATPFKPTDDLFDLVLTNMRNKLYICVLVDEAQFLTPLQVDQLAQLVDVVKLPVMCYGLRLDFQSNLFPGSARLMALADRLEEQRSICSCKGCVSKATHVLRLDNEGKVITEGDQVVIGGNDQYKSVCRKHWVKKEYQ